jgi:predicted ATPase
VISHLTQALPETSPIGRRGQFELLRELVSAVAGGRGAVAYVEGEPGIGKTSLVRAVAAEATMSGCQLYWATCDELSQAFPLVPLIEALAARQHCGKGDRIVDSSVNGLS